MPYPYPKVVGRIAQNRLEEIDDYEQIRNGEVTEVGHNWSTYTRPENNKVRSRHESQNKSFPSINPLGKKRRRQVKCYLYRKRK
jgi:hypothetical protein